MGKGIFDVLAINPMSDFAELKELFILKAGQIHPIKTVNQSGRETADFYELLDAYEQVNTEAKLNKYYEFYCSQLAVTSMTTDSPETKIEHHPLDYTAFLIDEYLPEKGRDFKDGLVDVFIPVGIIFSSDNSKAEDFYFKFPPLPENYRGEALKRSFDFDGLARVITCRNKEPLHVGLTYQEAEAIVNLHSHHVYSIIVNTTIPLACLSARRMNESEMFLEHYGVTRVTSRTNHFCLHKALITADAIIAVSVMENYQNTIKLPYKQANYYYQRPWLQGCQVINRTHPWSVAEVRSDMQPIARQVAKIGGSPLYKKENDKAVTQLKITEELRPGLEGRGSLF
ncbi:hypothetical protein [Legionella drancourtii]|uniref:Uncharacterized protein n=1 Tax=Legionella drancourtii LLAP12 TaxID=658187 RepID=G9ETS4_9GAMM|nr:hypothetical protein [Legionella drancourtii]EHL29275.1 hypothetical protein LDG_8710 [Legionella drancourtii LLAP12]